MGNHYVAEQVFDKKDFAQNPLKKGIYEYCEFVNCNFGNANLSGVRFVECVFDECNLALATLTETAFRDVKFKDCKMLGLRFDACNPSFFAVDFENCKLDMSIFHQVKLKNTRFKNTSLREVDFTEADLTSAIFDNCDLEKAVFDHTILEKTDFRTAFNYVFDPEINRIKKAKFSAAGVVGLLVKYGIEVNG